MWIKKSEWEEMKERIAVLEFSVSQSFDRIKPLEKKTVDLGKQIYSLNKHHTTNWKENAINERQAHVVGMPLELCTGHIPVDVVAKTENIPCVSFSELASYIIDKKPIKRKEEIEIEYY